MPKTRYTLAFSPSSKIRARFFWEAGGYRLASSLGPRSKTDLTCHGSYANKSLKFFQKEPITVTLFVGDRDALSHSGIESLIVSPRRTY